MALLFRTSLVIVAVLLPNLAFAEIVGDGRNVIDGDTFEIALPSHSVKIRICGIDAPESGEPGSREAWAQLSKLVYQKTVRCIQVNHPPGTVCDGRSKSKNRDRIVAQCFADGLDIGAEMVRSGHACDWRKFDGGYYQRITGGKVCQRN
ncbi:blr1266 [Bradyrhizobium diazoefficiens USDA 110]|uniref:Blr1266 protein n=2 Tax=Bradyrhizobium diazoefficiens TaxID=1355477 RepID=Q89UZ3_BRADU|nr:thermonuclease family protein [Bradyrhizobium diazoefficiens]QBP20203.1 thermonuclease family protein [Bradyrhizobium diazoefficiens]WLA73208.1 thermonuclease family protein [Bradyrhizobium diazoefficiens]BAC46531.1 blr1266 [Bradyrhizobium diazoefficiens USDA 110]BCE18685.1 hypothetical protein XF1B_13660 [Bradyrhizobium diazoefficiens]BCE44937.1 hypothetical protein XF4B_12860 [Bradyrhizobium diazoefficiens]